jgi:hypothetical protein
MGKRGENEGFHVLDDFVCEAIHAPGVPQTPPMKRSQNEGGTVLEEIAFHGSAIPRGEERRSSALKRLIRWVGRSFRNLLNAFSPQKDS